MRSLVLDQATVKTGFAVIDDESPALIDFGVQGKLIEHGIITAPAKTGLTDRLAIIKADIRTIIKQFKIQELVVEDTRFIRQISANTNHAMACALSICQEIARESGLPIYYQHPKTIKAVFTGYGDADKKQMISAVACLWRISIYRIKDDNHADALAAAYVWLGRGAEVRAKQSLSKKGKKASAKTS